MGFRNGLGILPSLCDVMMFVMCEYLLKLMSLLSWNYVSNMKKGFREHSIMMHPEQRFTVKSPYGDR